MSIIDGLPLKTITAEDYPLEQHKQVPPRLLIPGADYIARLIFQNGSPEEFAGDFHVTVEHVKIPEGFWDRVFDAFLYEMALPTSNNTVSLLPVSRTGRTQAVKPDKFLIDNSGELYDIVNTPPYGVRKDSQGFLRRKEAHEGGPSQDKAGEDPGLSEDFDPASKDSDIREWNKLAALV